MLVDHFTKVANSIASVTCTSVGISEAGRRITGIRSSTSAVWNTVHPHVTDGVEREVDIAVAQAKGARVDLGRIRLVEDVEESGSELELRRLRDIEVLEERDVEVAATRCPNIEGRL